jgi:hypothetical protein
VKIEQVVTHLGEGVTVTVRPNDHFYPVSIDQGPQTIDIDREGAARLMQALVASGLQRLPSTFGG